MISEGSGDAEDWCNDAKKISFAVTGINYILKYIKIETFVKIVVKLHIFFIK